MDLVALAFVVGQGGLGDRIDLEPIGGVHQGGPRNGQINPKSLGGTDIQTGVIHHIPARPQVDDIPAQGSQDLIIVIVSCDDIVKGRALDIFNGVEGLTKILGPGKDHPPPGQIQINGPGGIPVKDPVRALAPVHAIVAQAGQEEIIPGQTGEHIVPQFPGQGVGPFVALKDIVEIRAVDILHI